MIEGLILVVVFLFWIIVAKCLSPQRRLIILDLNGVLIHRERRNGNNSNSGIALSRFNVWVHPEVTTILDSLVAQGFDIAIWTSVRSENVEELLPLLNWDPKRFVFVWTQENCVVNGEHPNKIGVPNFTKPLDRVWERYPQYNASNTIIVDDSAVKLEGYEKNHLHVASWTPGDDVMHIWWENVKGSPK